MLPGEEKAALQKTCTLQVFKTSWLQPWLGWLCTGDGGFLKQALDQCYKVENAALHRSWGEWFFLYLSLPEAETTIQANVQMLSARDC